MPRQGRLTPKKDSVAIVREAVWDSGKVWTVAENLDPHTVQPVANGYTYYIIPAYSRKLPPN